MPNHAAAQLRRGGKPVDAADGRDQPSRRPDAPGRSSPTRRCPGRATSTPRMRAAAEAFDGLARHHAGGAAAAAARSRRRRRGAGRRLVAAGVAEHRQAAGPDRLARRSRRWSTRSASSPARPGCWRARPPGEYLAGHTSWIRREPVGRLRAGRALELPDDDGGLEVRPGPRRGQHRGPQALRHHARVHRCCWPRSSASSCRPACSTWSAATATPAARWSSTRRPAMVSITGSVRAGMEVAEAAAADVKRVHLELGGKAPVDRLRRRRLRTPRSRASRSPASSTPARTAPPPPGCWSARGVTTTSSPQLAEAAKTPRPAARTTRTCSTAR